MHEPLPKRGRPKGAGDRVLRKSRDLRPGSRGGEPDPKRGTRQRRSRMLNVAWAKNRPDVLAKIAELSPGYLEFLAKIRKLLPILHRSPDFCAFLMEGAELLDKTVKIVIVAENVLESALNSPNGSEHSEQTIAKRLSEGLRAAIGIEFAEELDVALETWIARMEKELLQQQEVLALAALLAKKSVAE
jgi:hypothetical protein